MAKSEYVREGILESIALYPGVNIPALAVIICDTPSPGSCLVPIVDDQVFTIGKKVIVTTIVEEV